MANVLGDDFAKCHDRFASGEPFGEDAKYDPTYQALRAEIQNLTAMSSKEGAVDWKGIKAKSIEVLATKSKDLTVTGYLTLALFYLDGFAGLEDGLAIMRKYLQEDWDGIFPPRPRGRILALEWLVTRLTPFVEERHAKPEEVEFLAPIRDHVRAIRETASERLMHQAPAFGDLVAAIAQTIEEAPPPPSPPPAAVPEAPTPAPAPAAAPPAPAAAPAPAPVAAPAPAAAPAVALPPEAPLGEEASVTEVKDRLRMLIAPLRRANPLSPLSYRLLRALKWDDLSAPPPAEPGSGKTRIPAPRKEQQAALDSLFQGQRWPELLDASEGAFHAASGTFWLDLQRYSITALERMDPAAGVRTAARVKSELSALLERFSNLPSLTFADGTPFASEATRQWIAVAVREVALPALSGRSAGADDSVLEANEVEKAQDLLVRGELTPALGILQGAIEKASNIRARFRTRLAAAQICLRANQIAWARTLLEDLKREMEALGFEDWEPETSVDVYQLLALCYARTLKERGEEDRPAVEEALRQVKSKLFRLDLRAVAAVDEALAD